MSQTSTPDQHPHRDPGDIALFAFPALLGVLLIILTMIFVPGNFLVNRRDVVNSNLFLSIVVTYFAVGSLVGTIPIVRSRALKITAKLLVLGAYLLGALLVLYLCLVIAILTTVVI